MSDHRTPRRSFWSDDRGTSTVEFIMVTGIVAVPLMLLYGLFWRGIVGEFEFTCYILSQPWP